MINYISKPLSEHLQMNRNKVKKILLENMKNERPDERKKCINWKFELHVQRDTFNHLIKLKNVITKNTYIFFGQTPAIKLP